MAQTASQIERHIAEERVELRREISALQQKAEAAFSWQAQFDKRPFAILGLAFGGGIILSRLFKRR